MKFFTAFFILFAVLLVSGCKIRPDENSISQEKIDLNTSNQAIKSRVTFQKPKLYYFEEEGVYADNRFSGARLNDFVKLNKNIYEALIMPENIPVNSSPWYCFKLWSKSPQSIKVVLKYSVHGHRFIPKLSKDGRNWFVIDPLNYQVDTVGKTALLNLELNTNPLWISAQENLDVSYFFKWLNSLSRYPELSQKDIGKSVEGKKIICLEVKDGPKKKAIVLIGRQHPPEVPGGTIAMESFFETLTGSGDLAIRFRQNFEIIAIPMLNPDGVDRGHWRHNGNGIDLNRDWQEFSQPETQAVRAYIEKRKNDGLGIVFGIDFHTSFSGPYLLVKDSVNQIVEPDITSEWIRIIEEGWSGYEVEQRPRSQELPYCYNWFFNELNSEAVTYEEGDEVDRELVKKRAGQYAIALMKALLENE